MARAVQKQTEMNARRTYLRASSRRALGLCVPTVLCLLSCCAATHPQAALAEPRALCATPSPELAALQTRVEAGFLFKHAVTKLGAASLSCSRPDELPAQLSYTFARGGSLEVSVDSRIEYFKETLTTLGLPLPDAVGLLKAEEARVYSPAGCGIHWQTPETHAADDGTKEDVYRGDSCNCQARVKSRDGSAVTLALSSAC